MKYACIVEAGESTRKRVEGTKILHIGHEDHIAGKGIQLIEPLQYGAQVHSFASKAMTIPDAKAAVDGKNLKRYRHGS